MDTITHSDESLIDLVELERFVTADDLLLLGDDGECDIHPGCQPIG
jgi:hypothetical protein